MPGTNYGEKSILYEEAQNYNKLLKDIKEAKNLKGRITNKIIKPLLLLFNIKILILTLLLIPYLRNYIYT